MARFGHIFPIFGPKKSFLKKYGCHAQLHVDFLHCCIILKNLMIQFQENVQTEEWNSGRTEDGQNLLYRMVIAGRPKNVTIQ